MDVDQLLADMLQLAHALQDGNAIDPQAAADELATSVLDMDAWLVKVGYLPARWAEGR